MFTTTVSCINTVQIIVKHYFSRVLISRLYYVENSLHFNLVVFPVNFIKQFVPFLESVPNFIIEIPIVLWFTLHITKNTAYHIMKVLIFYADKLWLQAVPKICAYSISRLYSNRENLMLTKYTCFTVNTFQHSYPNHAD